VCVCAITNGTIFVLFQGFGYIDYPMYEKYGKVFG